MLVLIIGGRYGSKATNEPSRRTDQEGTDPCEVFNSITRKEYETARQQNIPISIFVDKNVFAEYQTFKQNRDNRSIQYAYVDTPNVFHLLDDISTQRYNNFVRGFENFDDISSWLRDQWAGLFAEFLKRQNTDVALSDLSSQIQELRQVGSVLREYSEVMVRKIEPEEFERIFAEQKEKLRRASRSRFSQESLIRYIRRISESSSGERPTISDTYNAFVNSATVEDFLKNLGIKDEQILEAIKIHGKQAESDYRILRDKYLPNEESTDENGEEINAT